MINQFVDSMPNKFIYTTILKNQICSAILLFSSFSCVALLSAEPVIGSKIDVNIDGAVINAGVEAGGDTTTTQTIGNLDAGHILNDSVNFWRTVIERSCRKDQIKI